MRSASFVRVLLVACSFICCAVAQQDSAGKQTLPKWNSVATTQISPAQDVAPESVRTARSINANDRLGVKPQLGSSEAAKVGFGSSGTMGELPLLPAGKSDAVVAGTINRHQAFMSQDGTNIYTELYVNVDQVFKTNNPSLQSGETLTVLNDGGSLVVHGRKLHVNPVSGDPSGFVDLGGRYVFFLRYQPNIDAYRVVKAWRLTGNGPQALQPSDKQGPEAELLLSMSESQFLNEVQQAVNDANQKR